MQWFLTNPGSRGQKCLQKKVTRESRWCGCQTLTGYWALTSLSSTSKSVQTGSEENDYLLLSVNIASFPLSCTCFVCLICVVCTSIFLTVHKVHIRADSHYASRFYFVTFPSSLPSEWSVFTLSFVFSHLPEQHIIGGLRLFPSNMQPTAMECIFCYLLNTRTSVMVEW